MRLHVALGLAFLAVAAVTPACTCADDGRGGGDSDMGVVIGGISIAPTDVTLDLIQGQPPPSQAFTVTYHGEKADEDVTGKCTYTLADQSIGIMTGNTFVSGIDHGGTTTLIASYNAPDGVKIAQATIHVRVHGSFVDPTCMTGCGSFPPDNAPACPAGSAPTLVYPYDGALLPPNLNELEVQWTPGAGNTLFEVDFSNPATDVRIVTKCIPTVDTRMVMSGGCQLDLSPAMWDFMAKSNKGGDAVTITVRATTDGTCASPSQVTSKMLIAEQDIAGGIYYWKSKITPTGTGGDIWSKSFGDKTPEALASPTAGTCYGCHFLSRDGKRMLVSSDDNDSDDEYADVRTGLVDVAKKMFIINSQLPGLQAFNGDHTLYLASLGTAATGSTFNVFNGDTGAAVTPPTINVGTSGQRPPTMPDWSTDSKQIVWVQSRAAATPPGPVWFNSHRDDDHAFGGTIMSASYMGNGMISTPVELVPSPGGDNNYYPSISPDGQFLIFNRVPLQGTLANLTACAGGLCPNDSFSNPKARVFILSLNQTTPLDCERANGSPAAAPVDVSNSWPRWSPFVQMYKGSRLLWITFSSTRDYGLRVRNHTMVNGKTQIQCYPADSPQTYPVVSHGTLFPDNCQQPQLWMAAINLSSAEVQNPMDPSYPAFWLPFQDINTHNHTAQWTQTVVDKPPPDGGACIMGGGDCTTRPTECCDPLTCTPNGTCGIL